MIHTEQPQPPLSRVQRKRQERRERILQTALTLLANEGLDRLTIGRLARELDYAAGALYRYFDGKEALLVALQRRVIGDIRAHLAADLTRAAGATPQDPAAALLFPLLQTVSGYCVFAEQNAEAFRLVSTFLGDPRQLLPDDAAAEVVEPLLPLLAQIRDWLQSAAAAGALRGPATAEEAAERTWLLWSAVQGALQLAKVRRLSPLPLGRAAPLRLTTDLLRGWGAPDSALDAARAQLQEA